MIQPTCSHQATAAEHQFSNHAFGGTQQPETNERPRKNSKPDRQTTKANLNRVMAVDIKCLGRPEHEYREEIGAGDERN